MYQVDRVLCNGCEACVAACGNAAIAVVDSRAEIDQQACRECGECAAVCPQGAIRWVEEPIVAPAMTPSATTTSVASSVTVTPAAAKPVASPLAAGTRVAWRGSLWPVLGGALVWLAREVLPEALAAWRAARVGASSSTWLAATARQRWATGKRGGHRHRWGRF